MRKRVLGAVCALAIVVPAGFARAGDAAVLAGPRMVHLPGAAPRPALSQAPSQPDPASSERPAAAAAPPQAVALQSETAAAERPREVAPSPVISPPLSAKRAPAAIEPRGSAAGPPATAAIEPPRKSLTAKLVKAAVIRKAKKGRRGGEEQEDEAVETSPAPAPLPVAAPVQPPPQPAGEVAEVDPDAPIPPLPQPLQGADAFAPAAPRVMPVSGPAAGRNKKKQAWMNPTRFHNKCHASWGQLAGSGPFGICVLN